MPIFPNELFRISDFRVLIDSYFCLITDNEEFEAPGIQQINHYLEAKQQAIYVINCLPSKGNKKQNISTPSLNTSTKEAPSPKIPDDYIVTPEIGAHKFHSSEKNWNEARNTCIREGGTNFINIIT